MKKLITHFIIVVCLFLCIDRVIGWGLSILYRNSNATDEYKISYSVETTTDSILFMGSSRCMHHYVPSIFEKELGLSCFNTGDWGIKNIYFHYGLLCNILQRYTPKAIVLEIHPSEWLDIPFSGVERACSLAPYCGMSEGCDDMLKLTGNYYSYLISMTYRYTGSFPNLLTGRWGSMDRKLKGWKPLTGTIDDAGVKAEEYPFPKDNERIALLKKFIDICKGHDIQLIFIVSPMYLCSEEDVFKTANDICEESDIPFLNHYRDSVFTHKKEYFYDFGHMNREGAEKYSYIISKELKTLIH